MVNLVPLLAILCLYSQTLAEKYYYAIPTLNTPCPKPCFTLSQYVALQPNKSFASNSSLVLLPGSHRLESVLQFIGLKHLAVLASSQLSTITVTVRCNRSGRLAFRFIDKVFIRGIQFIGCAGNAIFSVDDFHLEDCKFDGNINAIHNFSVVMTLNSSVTVKNCMFTQNVVSGVGGVIHDLDGNVTIYNSVFTNNVAIQQGGVMITGNTNVVIHNGTFINNTSVFGGVMANLNSSVTIHASKFSNNFASKCGGIIYHQNSNVTIHTCTFTENSAGHYSGVMVHLNSSVIVYNSTFFSNTASILNLTDDKSNAMVTTMKYFGGVTYHENCTVVMYNNKFVNNSARHVGGAMVNRDSKVTMYNNTFINNTALLGGGVMINTNSCIKVYNSSFTNNTASKGGVMFHMFSNVTIHTSVLSMNTASKLGGAIFHQNGSVTLQSSIFNDNTAILASVMWSENSKVILKNSTFTNNTARAGGVMSHLNSNVIIQNSTFTKNTASEIGGVIRHHNNSITVLSSTFNNNTAKQGSVMHNKNSEVTLNNSTFNNNAVSESGGVMVHLNSNVTIQNSTFTKNEANISGGVMYQDNCNITIFSSTFANTRAIQGGVMENEYCNITLENCTFINNTASIGGVMFDLFSNVSIHASIFTNNTANIGGVILHYIGIVTVNSSVFNTNTAIKIAVFRNENSNVTLHNSTFVNNTAISDGVIFHLNSNITMRNTTFSTNRCQSGLNCSVLYHLKSKVEIRNSIFACNRASVMFHANSSVTMHNSIFVNNVVTYKYGHLISNYFTAFKTYSKFIILKNVVQYEGFLLCAITSTVLLTGYSTISDNCGQIGFANSNVTLAGETTIKNNSQEMSVIKGGPGALVVFQSEIVFIESATIVDNKVGTAGGGIFLSESKLYIYGNITISNNTSVNGGGIYAYQSELNFVGRSVLHHNIAHFKGGAIYSGSSTLKFLSGTHQLTENSAEEGGGIYLETNAKIYLIVKVNTLNFLNDYSINGTEVALTYTVSLHSSGMPNNFNLEINRNSALYGGAIFISDDTNSDVCANMKSPAVTETFGDAECFLQAVAFLNINTINYTTLLNIHFTNNSAAKRGVTLYGGLLDRCLINPTFKFIIENFGIRNFSGSNSVSIAYITLLTNLEERDIKSKISSDPVRVCFCHDKSPDCIYTPPIIHVRKGERFFVSAVAVDQVENIISNTSIHSLLSSEAGLDEGQSIQTTGDSCTELEYTVSSPYSSENITLYAEGPCKDSGISANTFEVVFKPCPKGFTDTDLKCNCDPKLFQFITNCSVDTESVLRRNSSAWISYINASNTTGYLTYPYCPFDYCHPPTKPVWINLNTPKGADAQCAFNRSGVLCGSCDDGLSLTLGSSRCAPCTNNWLLLLIPFAIAGLALVLFLHVLNMTVFAGTINGLIFYANIVFSNPTIFMPFRAQNSNLLSVFVAWLNLDLGFETCFYDGMDGYAKTWLQLAFPTYIIAIVVLVIVTSEYSQTLTKIISHRRNPVSTLATLILLSYTKLLRTVIIALAYARLEYPDGSIETVWLVDGNVKYFEWQHILLIVVAVAILFIGVVFTSLVLLWQFSQRCSNKLELLLPRRFLTYDKLDYFMSVYLEPYNANHHYYMGTLLLARVILYVISALTSPLDPSYSLLTTTCISTSLLALGYFVSVFKQWKHKILETLFLVNLIVFAAGTNYVRNVARGTQTLLANVSIAIAFVAFLVILLYHMYFFLFHKCLSDLKFKRFQHKQYTQHMQLPLTNLQPDISTEPTHTEVDACPPVEDTDSEEKLTANPTNTEKESKSSKSTTTSYTPVQNETMLTAIDAEPINRQDEMNIELQALDGKDIQDNMASFIVQEESDCENSGDEITPLLVQ